MDDPIVAFIMGTVFGLSVCLLLVMIAAIHVRRIRKEKVKPYEDFLNYCYDKVFEHQSKRNQAFNRGEYDEGVKHDNIAMNYVRMFRQAMSTQVIPDVQKGGENEENGEEHIRPD